MKLSSITVPPRQRTDLGDITALATSIKRLGLLQPIIVDRDGVLIAGCRRLSACRSLGWEDIPATISDEVDAGVKAEIEFEENHRRKSMSWQEECIAIADIHLKRRAQSALDETGKWTQVLTGELLGVAVASVNIALNIAHRLADKDSHLWTLSSVFEAMRHINQERETQLLRELAQRQSSEVAPSIVEPPEAPDIAASRKEAARATYLKNPLNKPDEFDSYYEARTAQVAQDAAPATVINITPRLHKGSCLDYLLTHKGAFDHIITDPPYGIDMDMLDQTNQGQSGIDSVRAQHDVKNNLQMLGAFIPLAYESLREQGFLVMWCDYMNFRYLHDTAVEAGFKVQRWPIVWQKTGPCKNSAAGFNFTKRNEIAIVCRKGLATLAKTCSTNTIIAGPDELSDSASHPFAKPYAVWEYLYEHLTIAGQSILDPFAGSGTAVISALKMNRSAFGCEIEDTHYNEMLNAVKTHYLSITPNASFK